MNIKPVTSTPVAMQGKLIPLSQYKGEILKLTAGDKKKIAELQKAMSFYDLELYQIHRYIDKKKLSEQEVNYYTSKLFHLRADRDICQRKIEEIKKARLAIQTQAISKLDTKI